MMYSPALVFFSKERYGTWFTEQVQHTCILQL